MRGTCIYTRKEKSIWNKILTAPYIAIVFECVPNAVKLAGPAFQRTASRGMWRAVCGLRLVCGVLVHATSIKRPGRIEVCIRVAGFRSRGSRHLVVIVRRFGGWRLNHVWWIRVDYCLRQRALRMRRLWRCDGTWPWVAKSWLVGRERRRSVKFVIVGVPITPMGAHSRERHVG